MSSQQIDRYLIQAKLGQGGMASVYRAHDPRFERDVAIKLLPREFLHDPMFRERFSREAKIIAQLEHPAIVPVYDFGEYDGQPYLVMRLMTGGSLADRIGQQGSLSLSETQAIIRRVAAALDAAHRADIVHRDVKPGNILFDQYGEAYLSDFGIVKLSQSTAQLTGSGIVGTPAYMAPEMAGKGGTTPLIDVYALGATAFQMLTGRQPFEADTPMGLLMAHLNTPVPDVRDLRPDLPPDTPYVLSTALAKDPAQRHPSALAFAEELSQLDGTQVAMPAPPLVDDERTVIDTPWDVTEQPDLSERTVPDAEPFAPPPLDDEILVPARPDEQAQIPTLRPEELRPAITERPPTAPPGRTAPPPDRHRQALPVWIPIVAVVGIGLVVGVILLATGILSLGSAASPPPTSPPEQAVPTDAPADPPPAAVEEPPLRVAVVLDTGGENDRSFNEYTLHGAHEAAEDLGLDFAYVVSEAATDYERNIETFVSEGYTLIITVGFLMGDGTAAAAQAHPEVYFAIIDYAYESYNDLPNVTSLMFAEDEVGYLAGVLAGCMTKSNIIGSVAGVEIPPVQKFVAGYQTGAASVNPDVETLNVYIPDFNDPATGKQAGQEQIANGADIIFGVGGNTGNGGLLAASEAGVMAVGVDVDQSYTYPEVQSSLITSAQKNMDVAAGQAVRDFAAGSLEAGIRTATAANGGVGLAPYHDWEERIPQECKDAVIVAQQALVDGQVDTGW